MKKVKTVELKMNPLGLKQVKINDPFWSKWQTLVREAIIPYQWDALMTIFLRLNQVIQ
jgi:DUF1680 family protein